MVIIYDSTYFFTSKGMITIKNTYEFISRFLNALIETYTTGQPSLIEMENGSYLFHLIIGYNNCFVVEITKNQISVDSMEMELTEIAEIVLVQGINYIKYTEGKKPRKEVTALIDEIGRMAGETPEVFVNYDIRKKTIDSILYAHENNRRYCIIYDELDDLSESYRIITEEGAYVICMTPLSIEITPLSTNLELFTEDIYNILKESENVYVRKQNRKIKKYIAKAGI